MLVSLTTFSPSCLQQHEKMLAHQTSSVDGLGENSIPAIQEQKEPVGISELSKKPPITMVSSIWRQFAPCQVQNCGFIQLKRFEQRSKISKSRISYEIVKE